MEPIALGYDVSKAQNDSSGVSKNDTDMKFLMSEHTRLSQINKDDRFNYPIDYHYSDHKPVDINPRNIITLHELTNSPNSIFDGRFFLCRTITNSIKVNSLLMVTEIHNPVSANEGVLLSLTNYLSPEGEENESSKPLFSIGTILMVNNPRFSRSPNESVYSVKCDTPGDTEVLNDEKCNALFPDLKWSSGEQENEEHSLVMRPWWNLWRAVKDWKAIARLRLEKNDYVGALEAYAMILNPYPRDVEALTLRGALYLKLSVYRKCLQDSETVLTINSCQHQSICHKALSLIGLGTYTEVIPFLDYHIKKCRPLLDSSKKTKLMEIASKAKAWCKQEVDGEYDIVQIMQRPMNFIHDCADYIGNVKRQAILGKGLGMVAKANINCGELIIATKAFAMAFLPGTEPKETFLLNMESKTLRSSSHVKLSASIAHRLLLNPELGEELYKLYDGTDRSSYTNIPNDESKYKIDMKRISAICDYNAFSGGTKSVNLEDIDTIQGLWPCASYINHSCFDANSKWNVCGNFMFIRASKNIKKGEEITLSYISCSKPYSERLTMLSKYGFICHCSLCQSDANDPPETHMRRKELLDEINNPVERSDRQCTRIKKIIKELTYLRRHEPQLNVCVIAPMIELGLHFIKRENFDLAADLFNSIHDSELKTAWMNVARVECCYTLWCLLICGNTADATKFLRTLKELMIQEFGTDDEEILRYFRTDLRNVLGAKNILR